MFKKTLTLLILSFLVFSCKTVQVVTNGVASEKTTIDQISKGHLSNFKDFKTLNIRSSVSYEDQKNSQSVSVDIRILKDETIWLNVKFLGFPAAKALITPTKVSYYEKLNKTYFEGDFTLISNWLGTELDFNKVQNLLLGKAIENITKDDFIAAIVNNSYVLSEKKTNNLQKEFTFEAESYFLKNETINQPSENRSLEIAYNSYQLIEKHVFPKEFVVKANQNKSVIIEIEYNKIEVNSAVSFPFSIPNGYDKIEMN
ncbi:DUF4292 domain-containing protein [Flavobacterium sp.]|uniref:DUF4292 domain-containing protein n=1 Tax=Flavobacterium sp. TaxID=239 RepID=UPI003F6A4632